MGTQVEKYSGNIYYNVLCGFLKIFTHKWNKRNKNSSNDTLFCNILHNVGT